MKVEAWCCERCGRLVPVLEDATGPPRGWLTAEVSVVGEASFREILACSGKCLALAIRPARKPATRQPATPIRTKGGYRCPECKETYERPQHLGLHRKRYHGVPSARERRK